MSSICLQFSGVGFRKGRQDILRDIDFAVHEGDVTALIGPSGVGKTTLLNLALGLIVPTAGRVQNGFASMGCVFQETRLLPWFSARDNIALGLKAKGMGKRQRRACAQAMGEHMGLAPADLDKFPAELSGGMAQRVALARALVLAPDILFLDEPFSALDFGLKQTLYDLLLAEMAQRPLTVLFITHDLVEAACLARHVVLLASGCSALPAPIEIEEPWEKRTLAWRFAKASELAARADVQQVFLARVEAKASAVRNIHEN